MGRNRLDYVIEVDDEAVVRPLAPTLVDLAPRSTRVASSHRAGLDPGVDFVSRFFAPRVGIPEDWVTGSGHCCLAPLWAARLGTPRLTALQVSARGGVVRADIDGERVVLSGQAVTVFRGELQ